MNVRSILAMIAALLVMSLNVLAGDKEAAAANNATPHNAMTTKETIQAYFNALIEKKNWESFLADDFEFTSFTSPVKQTKGRDTYLQVTKRFYSMITKVELKNLLVEGESACAFTHYDLQPPNRPAFASDVAELFVVKDGKIVSLGIYFDTAPFPK